MLLPRLLRTTAFRHALIYALLFGLSTAMLLGLLHYTSVGLMARQTDETIEAEIAGLAEQYRQRGLAGLNQVVMERSANQRHSLYLFVDRDFDYLAGNLSAWPVPPPGPEPWIDFTYRRPIGGVLTDRHARGRHLRLPGDVHLLVGRDIEDRWQIERLLATSMSWAGAITVLLGLFGGMFASRNLLRRVERLSEACRDIMAGDLGRRLPVKPGGDEIDRLAGQVNAMVARIESLMTGLRHVSDGVAHELRSPLTRMRARLEAALAAAPGGDGHREAIEQALAETEELLALFDALRDIAQAESGALKEAMARVDLGRILADVAELYAPLADEAGLTLAMDPPGAQPVRGHAQLLAQALANLVDNAVKYTPRGGTVTLAIERDGEMVWATVQDDGPGVAAADRVRAMQRFERLGQDRSVPGRGLGLSLVAAVAAVHGGRLELGDAGPGLRARIGVPAAAAVP